VPQKQVIIASCNLQILQDTNALDIDIYLIQAMRKFFHTARETPAFALRDRGHFEPIMRSGGLWGPSLTSQFLLGCSTLIPGRHHAQKFFAETGKCPPRSPIIGTNEKSALDLKITYCIINIKYII
jgi:hypothetical protein